MMNKLILIITLIFTLSSCGKLTGDSTGANDLTDSDFIGGIASKKIDADDGGSEASDDSDPNIGKFLLDGQADNINTGANFDLKFRLPEGESLTFHFYTFNDLTSGKNITFERLNGKVMMTMSLNSISHSYELEEFENIEVVDISIDVHNDHPNTHTLIWEKGGPFGTSVDCTHDNTCLYNTATFEVDEDTFDLIWSASGKASGVYWGMTGNRTYILELTAYKPQLTNV